MSAYNVGRHRHTPEIEQILATRPASAVEVIFTPHLVPMDRGILTTAYAQPTGTVERRKGVGDPQRFLCRRAVCPRGRSSARHQRFGLYTNFCDITARVVRGRVLTISCLDNLIKGASGAAVQNFNLHVRLSGNTAL